MQTEQDWLVAGRAGSAAWYERAKKSLAGGIGHDVRHAVPFPTYIKRASGAHKWDVDDNRYVDYHMGNGALLLGHAHPAIAEAVVRAIPDGLHFGNDHPLQVEWAELIQRIVPCAERIRFVNSGTEANMLATRLARAFTDRGKILRFAGHYHGWHDDLVLGFARPFDVPPSIGLAPGALDGAVTIPDNDLELLERTLAGGDIAAVILEASGASWSTVPLAPGFLAGLRDATQRHGSLLIFDEVVTGFRWSPGGAQERTGVTPDLSSHAKILAGGMPGAAVCGRADVMATIDITGDAAHDRFRRVLHYGTFNAAPVAAAAGIACLEIARTGGPQRHADGMAERLRTGLDEVLERRGVAGYVYGAASTFHIFLTAPTERQARSRDELRTTDADVLKGMPADLIRELQNGFRRRGVELLSYNGGLTSAAHAEVDIAETIGAFDDLVGELVERRIVGTLG